MKILTKHGYTVAYDDIGMAMYVYRNRFWFLPNKLVCSFLIAKRNCFRILNDMDDKPNVEINYSGDAVWALSRCKRFFKYIKEDWDLLRVIAGMMNELVGSRDIK